MPGWLCFVIGLFVGNLFGFIFAGLMVAAREMNDKNNNSNAFNLEVDENE